MNCMRNAPAKIIPKREEDEYAHKGTAKRPPSKAAIIIRFRPKRSEARPNAIPPTRAPTIITITTCE